MSGFENDLKVAFFDGTNMEVEVRDDDVMEFLGSILIDHPDADVREVEGIVYRIGVDNGVWGLTFRSVAERGRLAQGFAEADPEDQFWPPRELL